MTLLFTGTRGNIILSVLLPVFVVASYKRKDSGAAVQTKERRRKKRATHRMIVVVVLLGALGLFLQFVRSGGQGVVNILAMVNEFFYGNTFSDFRDGAFILHGYRAKYGHSLLMGKSYLAGLLSFIPSSISSYRQNWAWGRFTTANLFGMMNHFGLRGGNSMEAYLNFGILGVIVFSCLQGVVFGYLEKQFNYMILNKKEDRIYDKYLFLFAVVTLLGNLNVSSGMYNLYVVLLFLFILCAASVIAPIRLPTIKIRVIKRR